MSKYTGTMILPSTDEGMNELRKRFSRIKADIVSEMLTQEELEYYVKKLKEMYQ